MKKIGHCPLKCEKDMSIVHSSYSKVYRVSGKCNIFSISSNRRNVVYFLFIGYSVHSHCCSQEVDKNSSELQCHQSDSVDRGQYRCDKISYVQKCRTQGVRGEKILILKIVLDANSFRLHCQQFVCWYIHIFFFISRYNISIFHSTV